MSNDTIKRSDAIKATWQEPTYTDPLNVLTEVRDRIEAIPSADIPQGEWIEHEHGFWTFVNDKGERDGWIPDYECNLCGARGWRVKTPFCPTCGARMKGADDE